jgi:hypothetical protein
MLYSTHQVSMSFSAPTVAIPQFDRPWKAANADSLVNNNQPLSYATNYSTVPGMSLHYRSYTLPTERFQCGLDTPITAFPAAQLCRNGVGHLVYYRFSLAKPSWALIRAYSSGINSYQAQLYPFDARKHPEWLDSIAPIQNCNSFPSGMEFCNLPAGEYTLVYLINRSPGTVGSIYPTIELDTTRPQSRFDHAFNAYDFGQIPGDGIWYRGKPGDVHPMDTVLPPSHDVFSCRTGSAPIRSYRQSVCIRPVYIHLYMILMTASAACTPMILHSGA